MVAGVLSLLVPGLGQVYSGQGNKGAAILAAAILLGNLNLIFLVVFVSADLAPSAGWAYWIPRVGHDLMSLWSVVFWFWAAVDAYRVASQRARGSEQPA